MYDNVIYAFFLNDVFYVFKMNGFKIECVVGIIICVYSFWIVIEYDVFNV